MSQRVDDQRTHSSHTISIDVSRFAESETIRACAECGYDLRGQPALTACPECGYIETSAAFVSVELRRWYGVVAAGLILLALITLSAITGVLVQPFTEVPGGVLAAMNVPGVKVWAVPLAQRPLGNNPEPPGVAATRVVLVGMLAIWLITMPRPKRFSEARSDTLRLYTRWTSVVLVGGAFGWMLASQGIWQSQLRVYWLLLVGIVELPCTVLLYRYLLHLHTSLPGRQRRRSLETVAWSMPALMAVATLVLLAALLAPDTLKELGSTVGPTASAVFGAAAMLVAVMSIYSVASLGCGYAGLALRGYSSLPGPGVIRSWIPHVSNLRIDRASLGVAAGLILLVLATIVGTDMLTWMTTRVGLGANLLYFNFPGPKVFIAASLPDWESHYYSNSRAQISRIPFAVLNIAAIWLLTIPRRVGPQQSTRLALRWISIGAFGAALSLASFINSFDDSLETETYVAITVFAEMPLTLLLYVHLAHLSESVQRKDWAWRFKLLAVLSAVLVCISTAGFGFSAEWYHLRRDPIVMAMCAIVGAMMALVSVLAGISILRLAGTLVRSGFERAPSSLDPDDGLVGK